MFLHSISRKVVRSLKQTFAETALETKQHGNVLKTSLAERVDPSFTAKAVTFIENYAIANAVVLPGRISGLAELKILTS